MAVSKRNVITRGASGMFAEQVVFRQRFGQTIMCKPPCEYPPKTAAQIANQERFKRANDFAKAAIKDPVKKAWYKSIAKPRQTAFNAAFQDAYHKPEVTVKVKEDTIIIKTRGKHPIQKIKIISQPKSGLVEKIPPSPTGHAVQKNGHWEYKLTAPGPVIIEVHDIAGNICIRELQTGKT
jgi:hypothetical protein